MSTRTTSYVVVNEHTLGYVYSDHPGMFGILHTSILKGSTYDRYEDWRHLNGLDKVRPATKADFDDYRVVPPKNFV